MFRSGLHRLTSHRDDQSKYLKLSQKQVVRDAVRMSPLVPGATVRRNLNNLGPDKRVDPKLKQSVQRLVRKEKETILSEDLDGVKMDGSYGSLAAVAEAKWFVTKLKKHNQSLDPASKDAHHLKPGTGLVIGKEVNEISKVVHLNITTPHMLLHLFRAINSGWNITISGDGIYNLCKNEFGMVIFCVIGLHAEAFPICYSIVPRESISAYGNTWQGYVAAAYYFIKRYKVCTAADCQLCAEVIAVRDKARFQEFMKTAMYEEASNFPVANAMADAIPCWYNFVRKYLPDDAKVLNCKTHKNAIPHKKNLLAKHFVGKHCYQAADDYHVLFERIARNPWPELKELIFEKMREYLVSVRQPTAAHKFIKHHTCERKSNFMLCDCGYASSNDNNPQESHQRVMKMATQGLCGTKQHSGPFVSMQFKFVWDRSEEGHRRLLDSTEGLGTFQSRAVPDKSHFDCIQKLHPKTLLGIFCQGSKVSSAFHSSMQEITSLGDKDMPIYQKIRLAHEQNIHVFGGKGTLFTGGSYVMASQKLLNKIDPTGELPFNEFTTSLV